MATPFTDPRTGVIYFRRGVPEALRPAFDGRALVKISLRTKNPRVAKRAFARENAAFEKRLADARRSLAEGTLSPTPAAVVRRWLEAGGAKSALSAAERLSTVLMELDAETGASATAGVDVFPPATFGPAVNTEWSAVHTDRERYDAILEQCYQGNPERVGSNWIRARWYGFGWDWRCALEKPVARLCADVPDADRFPDNDLAKALLATLDEARGGDQDVNRARLADQRPRAPQPRLRPTMRLKTLFREWKAGTAPRPQSALEYEAAIDDFIDFAGDVAVSSIDADMLYDYRDAAADLPASMPRADRLLPFRERLKRHRDTQPKCAPPTLKKRIGALQAMLTYAFQQRWIASNAGAGIRIVGYTRPAGRGGASRITNSRRSAHARCSRIRRAGGWYRRSATSRCSGSFSSGSRRAVGSRNSARRRSPTSSRTVSSSTSTSTPMRSRTTRRASP